MLDFNHEIYSNENDLLTVTLTTAKLLGWSIKESKTWKQQTFILNKHKSLIRIFIFRKPETFLIGKIRVEICLSILDGIFPSETKTQEENFNFVEIIKYIQQRI